MSSPRSDPTDTGPTFGPYRVLGLLGRGGMGEVYRAYDTDHKREVALKLLPAELAGRPEYRARFSREAESAAGLDDPHVVPIHRYGEIDGRLYLDMRLVRGTDLDELLQEGPLPPATAIDIVTQVADALDAAHAAGLVHRDVKPSNVLLTAAGAEGRRFAYLCDFGIALPVTSTGPPLTEAGHVVGTCAYMAPERFSDEPPDHQADVYSLACLLFTALTGQRPFPTDNTLLLIAAHGNPQRPRPSTVRPGLPEALDEVVMRGMAVDRRDRYPSAGELARAAGRALGAARAATPPIAPSTLPAPAPPPEPPPPVAGTTVGAARPDTGRRGTWDRLADPWAWLIAATAGGITWAVLPDSASALPLGAGVAVVVLGAAAVGDALLGRSGPPPDPP